MKRRGLCGLLALVAVAPALAADDIVARVAVVLARPELLRASFTQEKRAAALTRPIVSRGRLTVARDHGVIWRLDAPIALSLAYRADALIEVDGEGRRRVRTYADNRVQAEVARVIRALLAGDLGALRQHFDVEGSVEGGRWQIQLVPRAAQVGEFVKRLQISGGRHVEQIRVIEGSADETVIRLRDFETPAALDAAERALLIDR